MFMSNLPSGNEANSALLPKIVNVFNLNISIFSYLISLVNSTSITSSEYLLLHSLKPAFFLSVYYP